MLADGLYATRREEGIRHIFNTINPGRKSSRIHIEDVSYKRLFFAKSQLMPSIACCTNYDATIHPGDDGCSGHLVRLCSALD